MLNSKGGEVNETLRTINDQREGVLRSRGKFTYRIKDVFKTGAFDLESIMWGKVTGLKGRHRGGTVNVLWAAYCHVDVQVK